MLEQHIKPQYITPGEEKRGTLYLVAATNVRYYPNLKHLERETGIPYRWLNALKYDSPPNLDVSKVQTLVTFFTGVEL